MESEPKQACGESSDVSIEERLNRLVERHEALTQTAELMAEENKKRDRRLAEIMEGIARLLHVAEIHEHWITRLERGEQGATDLFSRFCDEAIRRRGLGVGGPQDDGMRAGADNDTRDRQLISQTGHCVLE